jgi:hypothetical protein
MFAQKQPRQERRGIVLVLVLAMLGLLALVGVTFATFSGQARINARNFAQSLIEPQDDELMDFALSQLINDTGDPRSVIRGHSMARDMYGNDAFGNGFVTSSSYTGGFHITGITSTTYNGTAAYSLTTDILSADQSLYGHNFTRWVMQVAYNVNVVGTAAGQPPFQTFEVLADNTSATYRTLTVAAFDTTTALHNPTQGISTVLPGYYLGQLLASGGSPSATEFPFILDGRWLRAFNGSGMEGNAVYGNFRFNGALLNGTAGSATTAYPGNPNSMAMDEDYDACDLENWYLALQSADGQVMIPSFHRPGIIRNEVPVLGKNATINDWQNLNPLSSTSVAGAFADSASRILRPRNVDGNDATTFPDLNPDPVTGKITYDVDNDGDGATDSVWLDLGYPARRDSRGQLYKPLFAFMVIGLNGRLPLNTAGNLAGTVGGITNTTGTTAPPTVYGGPGHALHLGNSSSEIDPSYALQNGFDPANDSVTAFAPPTVGVTVGATTTYPYNSQVDTAGIDVRLTQLRNLLAGTRPQANPYVPDTTGKVNGDFNYVLFNENTPYYLPNGVGDIFDKVLTGNVDGSSNPEIVNIATPVPGRWGEAQSVPGVPFTNNGTVPPPYINLLGTTYNNGVRAGYSLDIGDIVSGVSRDAADDNYNSFDPYPLYDTVGGTGSVRTGEVGDLDSYDISGALLLPVERMRRWLTPADINGTGSVTTWSPAPSMPNRGADIFGRVEFSSYFRPPGSPGVISTNYTGTAGLGVATPTEGTAGQIYFPEITPPTAPAQDPFYAAGPSNLPPYIATPLVPTAMGRPYLPDMTNNPFHGYENFRFPNQAYSSPAFIAQRIGGSPVGGASFAAGGTYNGNLDPMLDVPIDYPTYDNTVNRFVNSDGLNEADEMNLYVPNPLLDSPFGPSDLEWLYRQQDIDGASLTSRLSSLAPISLTNTIDGARRRRLFALDSFEMNNFVWANDNPHNAFPTNSRFNQGVSASFTNLNTTAAINTNTNVLLNPTAATPAPTPSLAQRDKKINLNYPLPVSNDPNEPIRQKWISETYQLLKSVLPPKAVDTPEELAQLSQYVINIIDHRDPDTTMTHWVNPDVVIAGVLNPSLYPAPVTSGVTMVPLTAVTLQPVGYTPPTNATAYSPTTNPPQQTIALDQYGMEFNPVAINEVLAYSYLYATSATALSRSNRFCIELVNTTTSPELAATPASTFNPVLSLGGFSYTATDPYISGTWDIVFTGDDAYSRPDPYRGQLIPYANTYGLTPLNQESFTPTGTMSYPVTLTPLGQSGIPTPTATSPPTDYFYAFGNASNPTYEPTGPMTGVTYTTSGTAPPTGTGQAKPTSSNYYVPPSTPTLVQTLLTTRDPFNGTNASLATMSPFPIYPGTLPPQVVVTGLGTASTTTFPINYQPSIPTVIAPTGVTPLYPISTTAGVGGGVDVPPVYFWVCLRRPANPFAPVSATNPMVVVDSARFPYVESTGTLTVAGPTGGPAMVPAASGASPTSSTSNAAYSVQRFQPYRGGHAVPVNLRTAPTATPYPIDTRYGYTEQIVVPSKNSQLPLKTQGIFYQVAASGTGSPTNYYGTQYINHTIGWANEYEQGSNNSLAEPWDYFPFLDRDYTSVAELLLVPGTPPGLFTKQFVEFAPSYNNVTGVFNQVTPTTSPPTKGGNVTPIPTLPTPSATAITFLQPYATASTPLAFPAYYNTTTPDYNFYNPANSTSLAASSQPHTFPYLIDKFFYSGYGATNTLDPGGVVGGYTGDGWFKMFEFFEVPSQMIGAIGPVASGNNFDWARQDTKPGQLNLNLIIDEEVFFGLVGRQTFAQQNGQIVNSGGTGTYPSDQATQTNLNFDQIPASGVGGGYTLALPPGNYVPSVGSDPNTAGNTGPWLLPLDAGTPPIPMVVTSTLSTGAPASAYPLWTYGAQYGGLLAADPIYNSTNFQNTSPLSGGNPPLYTNALKAAWIQFLWLRHGGSGYMFGYGSGAVGSNASIIASTTYPGVNQNAAAPNTNIPAEIPFHSLSYPDIDYTIMRPAALPPTANTVPTATVTSSSTTLSLYPDNPSTYGTLWNSYSFDPGVRNFMLFPGYPSAALQMDVIKGTITLPTGWGLAPPAVSPYTYPFFVGAPGAANPYPTGVAVVPTEATYWPAYPPPIPVRRLFQIPDSFNPSPNALPTATTASASNASETGDPSLNLLVPVPNPPGTFIVPMPAPGALPPMTLTNGTSTYYGTLTSNVANLYWPNNPASGGSSLAANVYLISTTGTAGPAIPVTTGSGHDLGSSTSSTGRSDARQHPYWRTEHLQRVMNSSTVRTHQYAVWITIGFFEIIKQGDLAQLAQQASPILAFDVIGAEVGSVTGNNTRFRGFFLVDRTKLTGFNPGNIGSFRAAVVYRKVIQ